MLVRSLKSIDAWIVASLFLGVSAASAATIAIGETTVLSMGDGDNANVLLAQNAVLSQPNSTGSIIPPDRNYAWNPGMMSKGGVPYRRGRRDHSAWLGISDSNFDVQRENSSL